MEKDLLDYEYTRTVYTDDGKIVTTKKIRDYSKKESISILIDNIEERITLELHLKKAFELNVELKKNP